MEEGYIHLTFFIYFLFYLAFLAPLFICVMPDVLIVHSLVETVSVIYLSSMSQKDANLCWVFWIKLF